MEIEGWLKIHRKMAVTDLWLCEPFTKGQAWVDLILLANHKDGTLLVRGNVIPIKRGQVGWSQERLSHRWQWSRRKVSNFLKMLEMEQQIAQQKNNVSSIITIINYDHYQKKEQQKEQQKHSRSTAEAQQKHTNKNEKNEKKIKTPLPDDFQISDAVRKWAEKNNHQNLDAHLESFKLTCLAKGYQYQSWDAAFMKAVRDNWAKIEQYQGAKSKAW